MPGARCSVLIPVGGMLARRNCTLNTTSEDFDPFSAAVLWVQVPCGVARDPEPTRQKLIDAAARLMAEHGINSVSLTEIVRAANQANRSTIHYHFGSRDALLRAVLQRHKEVVIRRRAELVEDALLSADSDARAAAAVFIRPVAELAAGGWRERAFLCIVSELISDPDRSSDDIKSFIGEMGGERAVDLLLERCPPLPPRVRAERIALVARFINRAAADRARFLQRRGSRARILLSDEEFVDNLIDMVLGALTSPVTLDSQQTSVATGR